MPFKSESQRRYLWANDPKIAEAWAHGRSSVTGQKESSRQQGKRKGGGSMARHKGRKGGRHKRK